MNKNQPSGLMKTLATLQGTMTAMQKEIAAKEFEGKAANGLVVARIVGTGVVKQIIIDKSVLTEDAETVADLVAAAVNVAHQAKEDFSKAKLATIGKGMLPAGFGLPGLG